MKNEVFARAMTEIEEDLIISAHKNMVQRPKKKKRILAAAACFILICAVALYLRYNGRIEILVYGNTISDQPVAVDLPAVLSPEPRYMIPDVITIPLEIQSKRRLNIETDDATMEVYSLKTNELLCEGEVCKAAEPVNVLWIIEAPNPNQTYQLRLNNKAVVLLLSYDKDADNWILNKQ